METNEILFYVFGIAGIIAAIAAVWILLVSLKDRRPHLKVSVILDHDGERTGEQKTFIIRLFNPSQKVAFIDDISFEAHLSKKKIPIHESNSLVSELMRSSGEDPFVFPIKLEPEEPSHHIVLSLITLATSLKSRGLNDTIYVTPIVRYNGNKTKRGSAFPVYVDAWALS